MTAEVRFLFSSPDVTVEPLPVEPSVDIESIPEARYDAPMTDLSRQELDARINASEAKVDARLATFDASIKTGFAEMRADMATMRADTAKQNHESVKWIVGSVFALLSLSVAILGAMINFNKGDKAPAALAAQPAPIIITIPGVVVAPPVSTPTPGTQK